MPVTAARRVRPTPSAALTLTILALAACDADRALAPPLAPAESPARAEAASPDTIAGQYVVVFRDAAGDPAALARATVDAAGGELLYTYATALEGFTARLSPDAAEAIRANPDVLSVEPDQAIAADPLEAPRAADLRPFAVQPNPIGVWGLDRIDQREGLDGAYSYEASGAGVHVYILDSGIRSTHAEFTGRVRLDASFVADTRGPQDCNGHGTHVAGVVGSRRYGVAKDAILHSVRVLDCAGQGTLGGVIAAIDWVARNHQRPAVANMSLGGSAVAALDSAVLRAISRGVTFVVAAGNAGHLGDTQGNACFTSPARVEPALTVGASDITDTRASYSSFGPCVDLYAPGDGILSTSARGDTEVVFANGTSGAAPHVTGAAALYLERNPDATPAEVTAAITGQATPDRVRDPRPTTPNRLLYTGFIPPAPAVQLVSAASGTCLDVLGVARESGTPLVIYPCHGGDNQRFTLPGVGGTGEIRAYDGTLCLDAYGAQGNNGDRIVVWPCNGQANQQWTRTPTGALRGINDRCIDVQGAATEALTPVILSDCHGRDNQRWRAGAPGATPAVD